jgi:hypothetical protein
MFLRDGVESVKINPTTSNADFKINRTLRNIYESVLYCLDCICRHNYSIDCYVILIDMRTAWRSNTVVIPVAKNQSPFFVTSMLLLLYISLNIDAIQNVELFIIYFKSGAYPIYEWTNSPYYI